MAFFRTTHTRRACGCITSDREVLNWNYSEDVEICNLYVAAECSECCAQIGDNIEFVRFGTPVAHSHNFREGYDEPGMSCYQVREGRLALVGWHFGFTDRPAYRGTGELVGWGSDGEPLVVTQSIRKISRKVADALVESSRERERASWESRHGN